MYRHHYMSILWAWGAHEANDLIRGQGPAVGPPLGPDGTHGAHGKYVRKEEKINAMTERGIPQYAQPGAIEYLSIHLFPRLPQ